MIDMFLGQIEYSLISVFILGLVHGLLPCEHSWPIIFAYAISLRDAIRGILVAVLLTSAATLPWILIGGVCGYFGSMIYKESYEIYVHLVIGALMIIFGLYALRFFKIPHLHLKGCCKEEKKVAISLKQVPLYGFVLGFGPCVPVLMMYTFAAKLSTTLLGAFAGLLFGLGTMIPLAFIGGLIGGSLRLAEKKARKDLSKFFSKISGVVLILFGLWLIISSFY